MSKNEQYGDSEIDADIEVHPDQDVADGYRVGAHISSPGREGWWWINDEAGRPDFRAWSRPDHDLMGADELAYRMDAAHEVAVRRKIGG